VSKSFIDRQSPYEWHIHRLKKTLVRTRTAFQRAMIADSYAFGRCLILDEEIQSAERDEFIYHESLVHPVMVLHPKPQEILILGGGEGATVRELLKHPSVQRVTMVDVDGEVVGFCKRHLASWHRGSFDHKKTRLVIADARKYIVETPAQFDIIISDLPTPTRRGPIARLYTLAFYQKLIKRLKPNGMVVTQSGSGSPLQLGFHAALHRTFTKIFKVVRPYYAYVPSFDVPWAFLIGTFAADPLALSATTVSRRLGKLGRQLRMYDGETHEHLFRIPKHVRSILK
jgi:spermidine synthase